MRLIDVRHLGVPSVIGCWQVGDVLIDPGPASSLQTVIEALGEERPRAILLTHIHLDHSGGTGTLVRRWPDLEVWVHEIGAPHMIDPSKLVKSAGRLYGDDMERLWGEVAPVPKANVRALSGGESVHGLRVAYTPGHASHHVSYFDEQSGRAYVGDTAGVRIPPSDFILPPTPPPDIDLDAWQESLDTIEAWRPRSLGLTHFDAVTEPSEHIATMRERLRDQGELARRTDAAGFAETLRRQAAESATPESSKAMLQAAPPEQQWAGLDRYWRKRDEQG